MRENEMGNNDNTPAQRDRISKLALLLGIAYFIAPIWLLLGTLFVQSRCQLDGTCPRYDPFLIGFLALMLLPGILNVVAIFNVSRKRRQVRKASIFIKAMVYFVIIFFGTIYLLFALLSCPIFGGSETFSIEGALFGFAFLSIGLSLLLQAIRRNTVKSCDS